MLQAVIGVVLLALIAGVVWFFWPSNSRRKRELADPSRRFHWTVISTYMGDADPTLLEQDEARGILQNGWSCPDMNALRAKMDLYRRGEVNHAFDAARVVWLAELAVAAGWMPLAEVAQWSAEACQRVRANYPGWQAFGDELMVGRRRWWAEVAGEPMPQNDLDRAAAVRGEVAPLWASVPWA